MARLGWIGLGDIGMPMMVRLRKAGHEVFAWGRSPHRVRAAVAAGAVSMPSPAALANRCDAVFLCVTDSDAVEAVVFGESGVASGSGPHTYLVDHSTIHPVRTRTMAKRLRGEGQGRWIDAPVSGGAGGARTGTLTVMAGGDEDDFSVVRDWIAAYGSKITHVGPSGAGQACKSCNQAIANATIMVWAEMIAYAKRFGLEVEQLVNATEGGFADSRVREAMVPLLVAGEFPGHYGPIIPKDLDIVCDVGRDLQTPLPVTALVTSLYRHHYIIQERLGGGQPLPLLDLFESTRSTVPARS